MACRIAFCGTSRSGLGHLRRISTIAAAVRKRRPDVQLWLLTNAEPAGLTAEDLDAFSSVTVCERADMANVLSTSGVDLAVFDTIKLTGIGVYRGRSALILREVPNELLDSFRRDDACPWDCVLVPNAPGHWEPRVDAGFARRIEAVGWIRRASGRRGPHESSAGIVLATGGGGSAGTRAQLYPLLERVIASTRSRLGRPFRLRQALGPRSAGESLPAADEVFDPGGDLNQVFRTADLVISTAGYNSVLELAATDTPTMLVAISRNLDDQMQRVRQWGPQLGFGLSLQSEPEAPAWLADRIQNPSRRAPVDLGPDGASRAADLLLELL